ncbi:hypothetical protein SAMN04487969_113150 [Paenibacillus algorifonticola]|uniref:WD40-like Beta Propeller Repeat n=1 Tax=Paenibacillus algorifonticola TaxID=684063 RepID=A0A1I2FUC3_9BACL|nr:hypothetical protein [Paenibacillus algorifonticola]SFF09022.1 hypothetical protein SAMN04487969_113150 [Paenibacillus algorifonticola]
MKFFTTPPQEIRTKFEVDLLYKAQSMKPAKPPHPWETEVIIPAAGCMACGWNSDEDLVLISSSGYSITQARTGVLIHRDRDSNLTYERMSNNDLTFQLPLNNEYTSIFGFESGDGIHTTNDGWIVDVIYPWWPRASVIIDNAFKATYTYLNDATKLDINRLDGNIKCGFSPSGKKLVIMGSGGALIYSRE